MRLPRRPRSVCSVCWKGPFAAQLGLLAQPVQQHKATDASTASWTGGYTYTTLWYTMTMSAALGCTWCQYLIPYALRARVYTKGAPRDAWSYGTLHFRVGREARVTAGIALCLVVNDVPVWDRSIWVYTTLDDPAAGFISERPRLTDVGSDRTLALAKQCSDHCAREHPRCRAISGNSGCFVPARLIDCRDPRRPRIILTMGAQHVYVALSYVWGEEQPHRTTDANLSSHMDGIDPTQLPCTIRDAILVTYKLGLSFLWADSLCIIQDSPMDKHRQLVSMHNVYRYAYLTIDAEIASKASDGFLRGQRPLRPLLIIPFICPANPENPRTEVGNLHLGRYSLDSATPWSSAISSRHTRTRAWCLQEALVSTRALAFTEHTVQLRCQTTIENMGRARHNTFSDAPRLPDAIFRTERDIEQYSDEWLAVRRGWYAIVAEYSHRRLSYPSDTLVACAGLAKMFAHALGSEYVAGLWNDDFILIDLLWCVEYNCCARRPQRYLAPSWSWASMGIGVDNVWCLDFPQRGSPWRKMAEVVSCRITPQDAAFPLGPVVSGLLVLRAHVLACKILQPETPLDRRLVVLGTGTTQGMCDHTHRALSSRRPIRSSVSTSLLRLFSYQPISESTLGLRRTYATKDYGLYPLLDSSGITLQKAAGVY
ncbi:heterokaryon incompatibility protein-domain-containing protein [Cubamyces lactineus]|nr:heterokaryon incompatibility protein-domain-containing protein [Cubamyces lactineus]